ncbi:UDP-N-acetylglucosamine 2-epimerase (non-hydrolyzing) [Bradyrhizobium barranii subsp. barranii]|uniref:UDP-N-acetylglucosamine 2-epimerase (Non-hydrolyzing) n=1 Tax=Bradyrhizobium barranii subsp. barranii TaxID=2823807 RepID=A0A7Z0TS89_9BRAD|nr:MULTISPECIES: UDP-N-acetylglucosamine 2-epimerase (non-hydrolyzing) [Bradyrhizobium]UEM17956.1 UDP-N-acetylglucosamine 2-epimerase (non-hydrolyzing) [Bradyrhizobium barranii subsp. barranii]UGX91773.1 UDP-N-acetylglucosamine 2-epimerase (non-hydrolyzing) [Bradyrhizobium barranii subsp. barranii]UQE03594.1 UDP-N-acetylglucosamine 2-epimerase (non-hydrolyzing) [Bradyrhizobium japonicum]
MLKVMTVVGTRPEIIRLSRIIETFDAHFAHVLVHTGQNYDYELNQIFFTELGIRTPDQFLEAAGESAATTIGKVIIAADEAMEAHRPDALLVLGDTNSCLAAIAAKRRKIPIFHMEAGNRCFDFRVPEEINRRIVDHTADINLTYSQIARTYLLREGFPPDQVIVTGSPMREVLTHYRAGIENSDVLNRLGLSPGHYFIVSAHREENVDSPERLGMLIDILTVLATRYHEPVIVSTHPRTRKCIDALGVSCPVNVHFEKPFGFLDYVKLQCEARAVLSDSGTITEESAILNFPALTLRDVHERPEGVEEASVMMTGLNVERVLGALAILEGQPRGRDRLLRMPADYEPCNVSDKVLRIVQSYTEFVNQRVWKKTD